jgi:hypothetical protein
MKVTDGPEFGEKNSEKKNSEYYYMIYMEMHRVENRNDMYGSMGFSPLSP